MVDREGLGADRRDHRGDRDRAAIPEHLAAEPAAMEQMRQARAPFLIDRDQCDDGAEWSCPGVWP